MAKNTKKDQLILQLKSKIEEQRLALEKTEKPKYKSKLIINIPGSGTVINIHTLDEERGIYTLAQLVMYRDALKEAIRIVPGCKKTTEEVDNWIEDVLTKLSSINRNNVLDSLKKDEKELEELLSEDYKKDQKLQSILDKYV
jgi:predicted Fe-S protein YdhL (DUF1289 family)